MTNYDEIIRDLSQHPYETVFIIGTGIVKNGWLALEQATLPSGIKIGQHAIDEISYKVFLLRFLSQNRKPNSHSIQFYRSLRREMRKIRKNIISSFSNYQRTNSIYLDIKKDYFQKYKGNKNLIVTTNWDTLLSTRYSTQANFVYLHGNINNSFIYLPTETSVEPYIPHSLSSSSFILQTHGVAIQALEQARRIVLWGISLEHYDAEICCIIGDAHKQRSRKDCEYILINPCKKPLSRLERILDTKEITFINPFPLHKKLRHKFRKCC
ncbi:hypothetical protein K2X30_07030 [bacterium]|jgi:hypothetical protein|nr:hypothetical protein [bacterium]